MQSPTSAARVAISTLVVGSLYLWVGQAMAVVPHGCQPKSNWFPHSATPEPDNAGFGSTNNCEFHQWSWQMFLWLTQKLGDGQPRFLSFASPQALIGMNSRALMPRKTKSADAESLDEYLQAGTDGIFVDQNGRSVYYSQYVNPVYADFITGHQLTDPAKVRAFEPGTPFPIGSLEIKASWKILTPGEKPEGRFTMRGEVANLVHKGGKIVTDPKQTENVTLALVGFHIGGIVKGHPEMIWATFEHSGNAPNVAANPTPQRIVSDRDWTFYRAGTPYKACNVNPASSSLLQLDQATQKLSPITQACREFEFGNDPDRPKDRIKSMQLNDQNIASLNKQTRYRLQQSSDVWANYFEVGAIWFRAIDGLKPGMALATDDILTGSLKLSNATIETFTQTQSVMNNCFRCHNTMHRFPPQGNLDPLPALNINISHALVNIYFWSQQLQAAATAH